MTKPEPQTLLLDMVKAADAVAHAALDSLIYGVDQRSPGYANYNWERLAITLNALAITATGVREAIIRPRRGENK